MMHGIASPLTENADPPRIRVMLGSNALHEGFSSSWTWAALIGLVSLAATVCFSVDQVRKHHRVKEAERLRPDYELLDETIVALDKLAGTAAVKADLGRLSELHSRIKQAEKRSPDIPFGAVVAHVAAYQKTVLPDGYAKKLVGRKVTLDELLDLARQQGVSNAGIRVAIDAVQREIDRRTA